jgi:hypothetical protein
MRSPLVGLVFGLVLLVLGFALGQWLAWDFSVPVSVR